MHIEVDQSGKIEQTDMDTIITFSNRHQYAVLLPKEVKRKLGYKMTTEDAKAINATAEHDYLVRGRGYIRNLNGVSTNNLPLNSEGLTLSNKSDNASVAVLMTGGAILMNTIPSYFSGGNKSMLPKCLSNDSITLPSALAILDISPSSEPAGARLKSNPSFSKNSLTSFGMFSSARSFSLPNRDIFFLLEKLGGVVNSRQDSFFRELRKVVSDDFFGGYASAYQGENLPYHNSGSFESELSMANFAVRNNVLVDFNSHNSNNDNEIYKTCGKASGRPEHDIEKMIRGAGSTCIFSYNSHLSQCVLEGEHPSLPMKHMCMPYLNLPPEIGDTSTEDDKNQH